MYRQPFLNGGENNIEHCAKLIQKNNYKQLKLGKYKKINVAKFRMTLNQLLKILKFWIHGCHFQNLSTHGKAGAWLVPLYPIIN